MKQKYLYSLGVSFYAEKEMMRLAQQARKGWQFVKMNQLCFLVFKKPKFQEQVSHFSKNVKIMCYL